MIKKILVTLLGLVSLSAMADTIKLTKENTVNFTGVVTADLVQTTIVALENNNSSTIYLYINSPGGEVISGIGMVNYLQHTDKNIVCVASFAASMAHGILEACPYRVGTPTNILLQHKPSTQAQGTPTEIEGEFRVLEGLEIYMADMESKRIGISVAEFRRRTFLPWVTFGKASLKQNLVDAIEDVQCDGKMNKTFNGCPIQEPVEPRAPQQQNQNSEGLFHFDPSFINYERNFYGNI